MPHVIFELSDNVIEKGLNDILVEIHQILTDTLPTRIESCKSRILRHQSFLIGNGNIDDAFVHLNIEVLPGRSKATLDLTASKIIIALQDYFKNSIEQLNLNLSVSIKDLPATYHKL